MNCLPEFKSNQESPTSSHGERSSSSADETKRECIKKIMELFKIMHINVPNASGRGLGSATIVHSEPKEGGKVALFLATGSIATALKDLVQQNKLLEFIEKSSPIRTVVTILEEEEAQLRAEHLEFFQDLANI